MCEDIMNNQLDTEYDNDLLDALLSAPDSFSDTQTTQPTSAAGPSMESNIISTDVPSSIFSRYFMIGGSLFTRRRCAATRLMRHPRLIGSELTWIDYGSIYCPFTRQFVSLRSPHWAHLKRAGFGIDTRLRYGRRVALLSPARAQQTALSLLRGPPQLHSPTEFWSSALRQSLGALLESTAAEDRRALARRVREVLREESANRTGRRIPLGFLDFAFGESRSFVWGNSSESNSAVGDDDVESAMAFGEMFLRQTLAWRTAVLQTRPKVPQESLPLPIPLQFPVVVPSLSQENSASADLIAKYAALHALPFVVPGQRLAYLSLPCEQSSAMPFVVEAALRACESPSATLLYCPIEHGIDYHTVLDLRAFAVRRAAKDGGEGDAAMECDGPGVPLLDIGLWGTAAQCVVVVGNAHFLSRRAIARLLDQWTRNGAARDAVKSSEEEKEEKGFNGIESSVYERMRSQRPRRPLLLSDAEVICAGMPLFGDTRAVFIGHARSDTVSASFSSAHDGPFFFFPNAPTVLARWPNGCGDVAVMAPAAESVVSLDEPLVAAARRAAPLLRRMSHEDRSCLAALLCAASYNAPMVTANNNNNNNTSTSSSSITSSNENDMNTNDIHNNNSRNDDDSDDSVSRDEEEWLRRHAWVDALLRAVIKGGLLDIELVLAQDPSLAALRIRHALLREYPVMLITSASGMPHRTWRPLHCPTDEKCFPLRTTEPIALTLFDSRRAARECLDTAHDTLRRNAALTASLRHSDTNIIIPMKSEYIYEPFFEPPVLLGRWTRTFLFCAPVVADVLPLRRALLHDAAARLTDPMAFIEADVFHVDFIAFPAERRCRLFGVRLRYTNGDRAVADAALQEALAVHMKSHLFFPLWTPPGFVRNDPNTTINTTNTMINTITDSVDECVGSAAQPSGVERRLFALAAAQCAPLRLTYGSRVLSLRPLSRGLPRGTLCRVVRFEPLASLSNVPLAHVFASQQQRRAISPAEEGPHKYEYEYEHSALPVVRADGAEEDIIVLPVPLLIGGWRALHHYALPALQLPLLAPCAGAAASTLFHPLFAHEGSLMEFAAQETRAEARERLLRPNGHGGFAAHAFMEDNVFEENALHAESRVLLRENGSSATAMPTTVSSRLVHCEALSVLSLFPRSD